MGAMMKSRSGPHLVTATFTVRDFCCLIEQQGATGSGPSGLTASGGPPAIFVAFVFGSSVAATSAGRVGSFSSRSARAASALWVLPVVAQPVRARTKDEKGQ